ncbi:MAG TPA: SDR family oxidoreductase [Tepidisphaeraceae bacterium]|jgi:NAD(P)-dependent dehydrogenase (short-subunit alcohol dehydrogenase family)
MQMPDFTVSGRRALFTGAGRGIGLAMARALAAGGAAVAIQDIDLDVARREADAIKSAGGQAFAFGGDLSDPALPDRLADEAVAALGGVDILVNNGSIQSFGTFTEFTAERMRQEMEANFVAPTRLCQRLLPTMAERGWGRVINLGSIQGLRGNASMAPYAASRAAIANLTAGLAKRYGKDGITINCIAPGWFDTYRNRTDLKDEATKQERSKFLPLRRLGQPEDCAGLCLLLCSQAGSYITGQTLCVDGGMSI